ncbi:MAG: hypothetical protein M1818_003761 [Claussenomyces sp. TS43310]|nr:MAG: hypothetical protein M1818_003761 [Claussenomyces sp. TS43310]
MSEADILLERYLHLLDQYAKLRSSLSTHQSSIYQNIARANFAAERGTRYDATSYDARMQASRRLTTTITTPDTRASVPVPTTTMTSSEDLHGEVLPIFAINCTSTKASSAANSDPTANIPPTSPDPIRQFGLFVPQPLRAAQRDAIRMIEHVVPQLASLDARMRAIEIGVRRARKRAHKAPEPRGPCGRERVLREEG